MTELVKAGRDITDYGAAAASAMPQIVVANSCEQDV
jgi:hypothetical protein